jgi:integrase
MMIRQALKEKKIIENPFLFFEMPKYKQPETKYLTREEVDLLDAYVQSKECPPELAFIGNWFLISCWTALRYSDCRNFDKKKIKSGRIIVYTQKTGKPVSLPFDNRLKNLFERTKYRPLNLTNEYCNRMLKVICEAAGIDPCSYHASRHTFGVMAASAGIRRETIQVLMGHQDIKSTAIYAKLVPAVVDAELLKMK